MEENRSNTNHTQLSVWAYGECHNTRQYERHRHDVGYRRIAVTVPLLNYHVEVRKTSTTCLTIAGVLRHDKQSDTLIVNTGSVRCYVMRVTPSVAPPFIQEPCESNRTYLPVFLAKCETVGASTSGGDQVEQQLDKNE